MWGREEATRQCMAVFLVCMQTVTRALPPRLPEKPESKWVCAVCYYKNITKPREQMTRELKEYSTLARKWEPILVFGASISIPNRFPFT